MGFSRQGYWSGLLFPSPGDLPNPGIEPRFPALLADALPSEPPGKPWTKPRRVETKRKKEFNPEAWGKETSKTITFKKLMKREINTTQMKEQTRDTEVQINEEEIGKLPEKEFRIMIVKMIKNLESKMEESINKDLEELKNKHAETNNILTEIKNTLEGINSRLSEAED